MSTRRAFVLIFTAALLVRVVFLFAFSGEDSLLYRDSHTYIQAAKNLLSWRVYSMGYDAPPRPDSFRTPLYPLILLPFVKFGISWYVLAVIQAVAMSFAAALAYFLGRKIFKNEIPPPSGTPFTKGRMDSPIPPFLKEVPEGRRIFSEKIAFWGAMLFAIEPFGALIGSQIMTEAFFSLLFIAALYSFARYIQDGRPRQLILGALALAFAALLKQFALFFGIFILAAFFMNGVRPRRWKTLIAALAVFAAILAPWIIRNRVTLNTWDFSSQSGYNLYAYNAGDFAPWLSTHFPKLVAQRGVTLEPDDLLDVNFQYDLSRIPEIQAKAVKFISAYPFMYAVFHVLHTPLLFTNSGYNNFFYAVSSLGFRYEDEQALYDDISAFRFVIAAGRVAAHPVLALALIANAFFLFVALLAILSPVVEWRRWRTSDVPGGIKKTTIFFVAVVLFYAFLSSPISGARLRIPLNPVLFMLALHTLSLYRVSFLAPYQVRGKLQRESSPEVLDSGSSPE